MEKNTGKSTRDGFGKELTRLAQKNRKIVVVSADLAGSMRVKEFAKKYPTRFFEVGVAEQNAAGVAAGLALGGKIPFLVSFASFSPGLNWGQIRQSICLNRAPVKIVGGHAGLSTGPDGATHQILEDIAITRALPNLKVYSPIDYNQTKKLVRHVSDEKGPCYLRLTRPKTTEWKDSTIDCTKPTVLKRGSKATLIGTGPILAETVKEYEEELRGVEIINCPILSPIPQKTILTSIKKTEKVLTIEDHQLIGGLATAVSEIIAQNNVKTKIFAPIAVRQEFGESARDFKKLWKKYLWNQLEKELKKV